LKALATTSTGKVATSLNDTVKVNPAQGPYGSTAAPIPGTIQFENYDLGGNGYAYLDKAASNTGSAAFRTDEDVDIETCSDAGTGYNIGYATAGEWLEYTVNVAAAGKYDITLRVACNADGRTVSLSAKDVVVAKDIAIPNTAGWQVWQNVTVPNISLEAGTQVIRITIGASDYVNLNYMTFAAQAAPVAPSVKLVAGWNLIGCPIDGSTDIAKALSSIWPQVEVVKDDNSFFSSTNPSFLNTLDKVEWGEWYFVKVTSPCSLDWIVR
jgi:hypothetical protein